MKEFKNKIVVITGAASGIGMALTIDFADRGAILAICDNNIDSLKYLVLKLEQMRAKVYYKQVDVSNYNEVVSFAKDVEYSLGKADVVINNAGVGHGKLSVEEFLIHDMERIMNINFWGMVYGTKAFLPQLKKDSATALVNVSSIAGLFSVGHQAVYSASKYAIRAITEGLMTELKDTKIQVHSVHPGGIKTNIVQTAIGGDPNYTKVFAKVQTQTPEYAARQIIKGIERNHCRIIVGNDAKAAFFTTRILSLSLFNYLQVAFLKRLEFKLKS